MSSRRTTDSLPARILPAAPAETPLEAARPFCEIHNGLQGRGSGLFFVFLRFKMAQALLAVRFRFCIRTCHPSWPDTGMLDLLHSARALARELRSVGFYLAAERRGPTAVRSNTAATTACLSPSLCRGESKPGALSALYAGRPTVCRASKLDPTTIKVLSRVRERTSIPLPK